MEMEEEKEVILRNLGDAVKKVYGEWCRGPVRNVCCDSVSGVVSGVDSALAHGLRRPAHGYWPLLSMLLDQDTRSHLLLYGCPKDRGWQWVLRCLVRGELESLVSVVLSHLHLLPPLYRCHALLLDPSAQLVLPTLIAGLEHVVLPQSTEEQLRFTSHAAAPTPQQIPLSSFKSFRASLLSSRSKTRKDTDEQPSVTAQPDHRQRVNVPGDHHTTDSTPAHLASPVAATAPSPQFVLNVPQDLFPSLQPHGAYTAAVQAPYSGYSGVHCSIPEGGGGEPPIEACTEATEELNDQVFEAEELEEMMVQVHHFGKQKKKQNRQRSSACNAGSLPSIASPASVAPSDHHLSRAHNDAEAQEMSLEDELLAATHGDYVENRPPLVVTSEPDLIVGILGDDKLVKVLPDVSVRSGATSLRLDECDVEYCASDDADIEIVEVLQEKKEGPHSGRHLHYQSGIDGANAEHTSINVGISIGQDQCSENIVAASQGSKPNSFKKTSSHSAPFITSKSSANSSQKIVNGNCQSALRNDNEDICQAVEGGCSSSKQSGESSVNKEIQNNQNHCSSGGRSSQQQLLEARQLLKNLTAAGVIDQTPELRKLMESLEQREAMLSERSPPEGQEDSPDDSQNSSSTNLKKLGQQQRPANVQSDSFKIQEAKKSRITSSNCSTTISGVAPQSKMNGKAVAKSKNDAREELLLDTDTDETIKDGVSPPTEGRGSIGVTKQTIVSSENNFIAVKKCAVGVSCDDAVARMMKQGKSSFMEDELSVFSKEEGTDVDGIIEGPMSHNGFSDDEADDNSEGDVPDDSLVDVDVSVGEAELNIDDEMSQVTTDADPNDSHLVMSCSSGSDSDTDVDKTRHDVDGCFTDDDMYLYPHLRGNRPTGVGVDTDDSSSSSSLSDDCSSTGVGEEDADDTAESDEDEKDLQLSCVTADSYHRRPLPLVESLCSLEDDCSAPNKEEEALTEGCREKTGIVGGSKWEELMGGGNKHILLLHTGEDQRKVTSNLENNLLQARFNELDVICDERLDTKTISVTSVTRASIIGSLNSTVVTAQSSSVSVSFVASVPADNIVTCIASEASVLCEVVHDDSRGTSGNQTSTSAAEPLNSATDCIQLNEDINKQGGTDLQTKPSSELLLVEPLHSTGQYDNPKDTLVLDALLKSDSVVQQAEADSSQLSLLSTDYFYSTDKFIASAGITRTLSLSSCGSKCGGPLTDCGSRFDSRSDGKLSAILDSTRLDCRLDSTSESVVAALDDAAREAQLQLLHLHTQLLHYRRMAARKKARKVLDAKLNPAIKVTMLALKVPVRLLRINYPIALYPLKHDDVPVSGCKECDGEAEAFLHQQTTSGSFSAVSISSDVTVPDSTTASFFRRPGERLQRVFVMREGHARGVSCPVRVLLSSHALYVLNTCPAPRLLHALPYTQLHTVVLAQHREWVAVLSRGAVESGGEWRGAGEVHAVGPGRASPVVGIQLCVADADLAEEFIQCLEVQTRRALMTVLATEMRLAAEGKLLPSYDAQFLPSAGPSADSPAVYKSISCKDYLQSASDAHTLSGQQQQVALHGGDTRAHGSKVSTPQELGGQSFRNPSSCFALSSITVGKGGRQGLRAEHFGLTDSIEHLVPNVVESGGWEQSVLQQWLRYLLPSEAVTTLLGSWLVDWDGGARLGQQGALGPTMEGPLLFRTTKLFSSWRSAHFLLKAGVLYQFGSSSDRLPHTMLDVTSCSVCIAAPQLGRQHAFQVIQSDGSPLLLAASDAEEAARWTRAIGGVLATAGVGPSRRRPLPCRLLLLPHCLLLLHQTDLLLAPLPPATPPPPPYPTPAHPPSLHGCQQQPQVTQVGGGVVSCEGGVVEDVGRDSRTAMLPALGNLKNSRHLSSSLSSLTSNTSQTNILSAAANNLQQQQKLAAAATASANVINKRHSTTSAPPVLPSVGGGGLPLFPPNPPRSLALSSGGRCRKYSGESSVSTGQSGHAICATHPGGLGGQFNGGGEGGEGFIGGGVGAECNGGGRLPLNKRAEALLVARLELRHLSCIARYSECAATTILEVQPVYSSCWRSDSSGDKDGVGDLPFPTAPPPAGDWALYFRGARQLEQFLAVLARQVVVCEREVSDTSVQQFLLEGAQASAGGWAAPPSV